MSILIMSSRPRFHQERRQAGFTFFEVAISLGIAAFSVLTVMALIPAALKSQQKARYELLAATKEMELIDFFSGKPSAERIAEFESPEPWEARPWSYTSTRWDFECRTSRWDSGVMPVPLDIANRLDSDNDEIHSLLSQGAYLYYADPRTIPSVDTAFTNPTPPNEALKLVFAVTGYAQNNAIPVFSYKGWPYRAGYPSPPMTDLFNGNLFQPINFNPALSIYGIQVVPFEGWCNGDPVAQLPGAHDPTMDALVAAAVPYQIQYGQGIPAYSPNTRVVNLQPLQGNLQAAVFAFIKDKYANGRITNPLGPLPVSGYSTQTEFANYYMAPGVSDFVSLGQQYDADFNALCQIAEPLPGESYGTQSNSGKAKVRAELALRVQCMRFMSMIMSTYWINGNGIDPAPPDLTMVPTANNPFAPDQLSTDRLRYYHDRAMAFSMRYAASFPYDWGAPRPLSRCIMTDYPLIEYDMFSPPHTGTIVGCGVAAAQWCPISAQTITDIGLSTTYPGALKTLVPQPGLLQNWAFDNTTSPFVPFDGFARTPQAGNIWGDASHFTLTKPFAAAERCRQLVFWSVDWQSYEDAETAPSAPQDASRCPLDGPAADTINQPYANRLNNGLPYEDGLELRNPERLINFTSSVANLPSGTSLSGTNLIEYGNGFDTYGSSQSSLDILNGIYGADRNHNYILDRGPTKKSMRLHASLVARFNFYDPRLPITMR